MKSCAGTEPRSNYRWLLPLIAGACVALLLCVVAGLGLVGIGLRKALATQRAATPVVTTTEVIAAPHHGLDAGGFPLAVGPESPPGMPPMPVVVSHSTQKWEYKIAGLNTEELNKLGANGWRVISVPVTGAGATALLERPLHADAAAAPVFSPDEPKALKEEPKPEINVR